MRKNRCRKDFTGAVFKYIKVLKVDHIGPRGGKHYLVQDIFGATKVFPCTDVARRGFGTKLWDPVSRLKKRQLKMQHWGMISRCHSKSSVNYYRYGKVGIKVCKEWRGKGGARRFCLWAIEKGWRKGLSIDRLDPEKGYSPDNCQLISHKDNSIRRRNVYLNWEKAAILNSAWEARTESVDEFFKKWAAIFKCSLQVIQAVVYKLTWVK